MAVVVYFPPSDMTVAQYDSVSEALEAAGAFPAPGMLMHSCFKDGDKLSVCDLWESAESFKAFGETLMPLLAKAGVNLGEPYISECYNYVIPEPARA